MRFKLCYHKLSCVNIQQVCKFANILICALNNFIHLIIDRIDLQRNCRCCFMSDVDCHLEFNLWYMMRAFRLICVSAVLNYNFTRIRINVPISLRWQKFYTLIMLDYYCFFPVTQTMHCIVIYNAYCWQSTFKLNHVGSY